MIEIKIPSVGESISEVDLTKWLVKSGDFVIKNQDIAEIDSDKASITIAAEADGIIEIRKLEGEKAKIGEIIANIKQDISKDSNSSISVEFDLQNTKLNLEKSEVETATNQKIITPLAKNVLRDVGLNLDNILEGQENNRITKQDILMLLQKQLYKESITNNEKKINEREEELVKLSPLRKKLAERLVAVKNQTAMLTTFNEIDLSKIIELRNKYKEQFIKKHNVKLGFVSFFTKACIKAFQQYPQINSSIDGDNLIIHKYADIGIAVSAPKGLVVPVIRNANFLNIAELEIHINKLASKARENKITLEEMTGGTFTITNGGIFGSMMSTPILNPPQCAILGMHKIIERPIVLNGKIEIRPMMYVALSYDHRIIDGRESVGFIVRVKELLENPIDLLFDNVEAEKVLLDL